jgi:hexulose-6-phosphate isomerase
MKTGISIWAFPSDWKLDKCFALTAETGFDGIELAYASDGPLTASTTSDDINSLLRLARSTSVEILSLASGIFWSVNLLSDDSTERDKAKAHLCRMLEVASDLEVPTILVVPGFAGPFEAGPPVIRDYQLTFDRAIADFQGIAPLAERLGVSIGIENVWNKFLSSPIEMRAFVDAVGSQSVGVYFDVANCLRTGYPEHWIQLLAHRIKGVHFKDFRVNVGTLLGFTDLFEGDVDFGAVVSALHDVSYRGACVVEAFTRTPYPEVVVQRAGADIRRVFDTAGVA